jgi:hypothetical protein
MQVGIHSQQEISSKGRGNQHVDIFNAKNSSCTVIKNPEIMVTSNIFQQRSDEAYDRYQDSVKRPSSSHRPANAFRDDKCTFDSEWCNPKFEHQKTLVNESAQFQQDYHHQRRLDELTSSIFVSQEGK